MHSIKILAALLRQLFIPSSVRLIGTFSIVMTLFASPSYSQTSDGLRVILIRHGEKPDKGYNLNCQGLNRARELPSVLYSKFGVPNLIYVPHFPQSDTSKHGRMYQTIAPFADKYNLKINSDYKESDIKGVAKNILKQNGTVLLVWEHKDLNDIAEELGVTDKLHWSADDFDTIWIITYSKKGKARLTVDHENLHPSKHCH